MFAELEAMLSQVEGSLVRFLGEGKASVNSIRAEAERIDQSVRKPLDQVGVRVKGLEAKVTGHFARLRAELKKFEPPPPRR